MHPRLSVLTLTADNLSSIRNFYERILGWKPEAFNKDIVFYKLNGFLLSFCERKLLGDFIGVEMKGRSATIGYNVKSKEEVLELFEQLKTQVKIIKEPTEPPFGGLFFYFEDVEGNILEVAHNPYVVLDEQGNVAGHLPIEI